MILILREDCFANFATPFTFWNAIAVSEYLFFYIPKDYDVPVLWNVIQKRLSFLYYIPKTLRDYDLRDRDLRDCDLHDVPKRERESDAPTPADERRRALLVPVDSSVALELRGQMVL